MGGGPSSRRRHLPEESVRRRVLCVSSDIVLQTVDCRAAARSAWKKAPRHPDCNGRRRCSDRDSSWPGTTMLVNRWMRDSCCSPQRYHPYSGRQEPPARDNQSPALGVITPINRYIRSELQTQVNGPPPCRPVHGHDASSQLSPARYLKR